MKSESVIATSPVVRRGRFAAWMLACVALLGACGAAPSRSGTEGDVAPAERIGVYDGRAVAIAYANSAQFAAWIAALRQKHDEAKARGDAAAAAEFEAQAVTQQERLHGQAFGGDPVDDVLEQVQEQLPALCAKAKVSRLVALTGPHQEGDGSVDVTDALVELFHPDERARGWIADIRSKPLR